MFNRIFYFSAFDRLKIAIIKINYLLLHISWLKINQTYYDINYNSKNLFESSIRVVSLKKTYSPY